MRRLQVFSIACALLAGSANVASAQSVLTDTYYDQKMTRTCKGSALCKMEFNKVPSTKAVEITNIACQAETGQQIWMALLGAAETANGPITRSIKFALRADAVAMSTGRTSSSVDIPVRFLIPQGRVPRIEITSVAADTVVLDCTLSGTPRPPL